MGWNSQVVVAEQVIIEGGQSGLFVYDVNGNLVAWIVGQTTPDPIKGIGRFGPVIAIQAPGTPSGIQLNPDRADTIALAWSGQTAMIQSAGEFITGAASEQVSALVASVAFGLGGAAEQLGQLLISAMTAQDSMTGVLLTSESADGTVDAAAVFVSATRAGSAYTVGRMLALYPASMQAVLGPGFGLYGSQPGLDVTEGWHTLTLAAGFSGNITGEYAPQYRWLPLHGGAIAMRGMIQASASVDGGSVFSSAAIPSGYRPAQNVRWPALDVTSAGAGNVRVVLDSGGNLSLNGHGTSAGDRFDLGGIGWIA